jgi:ubiquinone/menaquinone biosynthesis C-methylase UbiE
MVDPLAGSPWSRPETVAGFKATPPNATLTHFAESELQHLGSGRTLDIGCGVGRNAIPLAVQGWNVIGIDLSLAMIQAAVEHAMLARVQNRVRLALAAMDALPVRDRSCDLIIAHGIWNLAPSAATFRRAVREAARVARASAGLFVFTFSRNTLTPQATPLSGEPFVFTDFSGAPQCFLTEAQLVSELASAGFDIDPSVGVRELNRRSAMALRTTGSPVIYEATFRYRG